MAAALMTSGCLREEETVQMSACAKKRRYR